MNTLETTEETRENFSLEVGNNEYEQTLRHYWKQEFLVQSVDVIRSGYRIHFRKKQPRQLELV